MKLSSKLLNLPSTKTNENSFYPLFNEESNKGHEDIKIEISKFLHFEDLVNLAKVNKEWRQIITQSSQLHFNEIQMMVRHILLNAKKTSILDDKGPLNFQYFYYTTHLEKDQNESPFAIRISKRTESRRMRARDIGVNTNATPLPIFLILKESHELKGDRIYPKGLEIVDKSIETSNEHENCKKACRIVQLYVDSKLADKYTKANRSILSKIFN